MDILAFMQYLSDSGMSPDNIVNHLTAIRSLCGCDTTPFRDQRLPLFVKSLKINRNFQPTTVLMVDDQMISIFLIDSFSQLYTCSLSFHFKVIQHTASCCE